ncbi:MAG: hypothetical protein WAU07_03540 [Microgenomates group bacterium]
MKFFPPKTPRIASKNSQTSPATFGEARAVRLNERMEKAVTERRKLAVAEAGAHADNQKPLDDHLKNRGQMVERKIDRLHNEQLGIDQDQQ